VQNFQKHVNIKVTDSDSYSRRVTTHRPLDMDVTHFQSLESGYGICWDWRSDTYQERLAYQ